MWNDQICIMWLHCIKYDTVFASTRAAAAVWVFAKYYGFRLESYIKMVIEGKRECVNVGMINVRIYAHTNAFATHTHAEHYYKCMNIEIVSKMCVLIKFIYWALCRLWKAEGETSIKIHLHLAVCECELAREHTHFIYRLCKQTYARKKRSQQWQRHESKACISFTPFWHFRWGWQHFWKWFGVHNSTAN